MTTIKISGMKCGHCVAAVTKALQAIDGLADVTVDLENQQASYTKTHSVDSKLIKDAILEIGFAVE